MFNGSSVVQFFLGSTSLGFLTLHETENSGYVASLLVTNVKGIPKEFRCTHPIKPDAIQRSLYGTGLVQYIGVEICGRPLLRSVRNKPKIIFVDKPFLMNLEAHASTPIIFIKEIVENDPSILANNQGFQTEVIELTKGDPPLQIIRREEIAPKTIAFIEEVSQAFNITETFERMRQAVQNLNQLDATFSS